MISTTEFLEKVKEFEGLRLKSYKCPSGVLTIGYGHTHGVTSGMSITKFMAQIYLEYDIDLVTMQIASVLPGFASDSYPISCGSPKYPFGLFLALIDFVFNIGFTKFKNSTLRKVVESIDFSKPLSNNDKNRLTIQFMRWTRSNGKVLKGLEARRSWEVSLFCED